MLTSLLDASGLPLPPRRWPFQAPRVTDGMPGPPPRLLGLGHLLPVLRGGLLPAYHRWALEQGGEDFVVWLGTSAHVVVARPASVLEVLSPDEARPRFQRNVAPTQHIFGKGMLRLEGEPWAARRRLLSPVFRGEALTGLIPIVQEETDRLIHRWSAYREPFRPNRDLSFMMLRILGRLLFDFSFDPERHGGRPLHRALVTLASNTVLRLLFPNPLVSLVYGRKVRRAREWMDTLCEELLQEGGDTPFLGALRGALSRGELDRQTVKDDLRTFIIAGHETTATALAWTVASLASEAGKAETVVAEGPAAAQASTAEDVGGLEATTRWVKEVMRLYPPVPLSVQQSTEETTLGRIHMPAGTPVDVCSYLIHRLPNLWPEPERFDPDRFLQPPAPGTWLPFLLGPHSCIGLRMAMLELPLIAARLAGAFHFALPNGPPRVNLRLSLHPADFTLAIRPR